MSRVLAACLPVAAVLVLLFPAEFGALAAAVAVSGAIVGVWSAGSLGDGPAGRRAARRDRMTAIGFGLSLGAGTALAAGLADGPGFFGLPRSLWGLLLGVWLLPLVITSIGFGLSYHPPDAAALDRLRAASRRDA